MDTADNLLAALSSQLLPAKHVCYGCGYEHQCSTQGCRIIREVIAQLERARWIPVTEQKPEDNKDVRFYTDGNLTFATVLVYDSEKGVRTANRFKVRPCGIPCVDECATRGWEWSVGDESATHWMPLPKPPKEERHDPT